MTVKAGVSMGRQGCRIEEELELEDGMTEEEIEAYVSEWALQHVNWWHETEPTK